MTDTLDTAASFEIDANQAESECDPFDVSISGIRACQDRGLSGTAERMGSADPGDE